MHVYAQNMHKIFINMHTICINIQKICRKYADICIRYAQNMPLHRLQHSKYHQCRFYAKIIQKICSIWKKICKKYSKNMQNMHKSMYWHIFHPTLLMMITGGNSATRHLWDRDNFNLDSTRQAGQVISNLKERNTGPRRRPSRGAAGSEDTE